jgi:hypothetical protein
MADKKPLTERVLNALSAHGPMTLESLAKHADTTVSTLYTMMGTLKKKHGVARVGHEGKAAIYGIAGNDTPPQRRKAKKPTRVAPKKDAAGSALLATVRDLKQRRDALMADVSKIDRAIEAVEALAA